MISLDMLLLTEVQEQAADMADSILTVLILEIFSEISLEICSAADAEADVRTRLYEKTHGRNGTEQVPNREHLRRLVRNAAVKVRLYIHSSLSLEPYRMYRPVQIARELVRLLRKNVRIAAVQVM